jgi:FlaA1/EpsC-like NDP-sugar epimerase
LTPIFLEQIAKGGPVTVTHPEMRRYFMTIPEASQLAALAKTVASDGVAIRAQLKAIVPEYTPDGGA